MPATAAGDRQLQGGVLSGATNHAEVIEVAYDPQTIGLGQILRSSSRSRTIRPR